MVNKNKALHPTDLYRKEQRKKEIKNNKSKRNQVRVPLPAPQQRPQPLVRSCF